jgi:hypothetical protein
MDEQRVEFDKLLKCLKNTVDIRDRKYFSKVHESCFVGKQTPNYNNTSKRWWENKKKRKKKRKC